MATIQDTFEDWTNNLREEISERRERRQKQVKELGRVVRSIPFAALGSTARGLDRGRDAFKNAFELPGRLVETASTAPERIGEAFEENTSRGRKIISRVMDREAIQDAADQFESARSHSKAAATSVRRAARKATEAVEEAAEAAFSPQDTRPYEERTLSELRDLAGERGIAGRSGMKKAQLVKALRKSR